MQFLPANNKIETPPLANLGVFNRGHTQGVVAVRPVGFNSLREDQQGDLGIDISKAKGKRLGQTGQKPTRPQHIECFFYYFASVFSAHPSTASSGL